MNYLLPLLFISVGYLSGWLIRYVVSYFSKPISACNIKKPGRILRFTIGTILILLGIISGGSLWYIAGGFTLYESRAKWCIARAIMK